MKEELYRGHLITTSAWQKVDTQQWEPRVLITWEQRGTETSRPYTVYEYFPTREQADSAALAFAKQTIDAGNCGAV